MNVPRYAIRDLEENTPWALWPAFALVLGILHLFWPCCVSEYVLRLFGEDWRLPLPPWPETQYYDHWNHCQLCLFCSRKASRLVGMGDDWW